jgi:hypothetical protein
MSKNGGPSHQSRKLFDKIADLINNDENLLPIDVPHALGIAMTGVIISIEDDEAFASGKEVLLDMAKRFSELTKEQIDDWRRQRKSDIAY